MRARLPPARRGRTVNHSAIKLMIYINSDRQPNLRHHLRRVISNLTTCTRRRMNSSKVTPPFYGFAFIPRGETSRYRTMKICGQVISTRRHSHGMFSLSVCLSRSPLRNINAATAQIACYIADGIERLIAGVVARLSIFYRCAHYVNVCAQRSGVL